MPCALGDEAVVKIYKGSRFKKIKYRGVWKGLCASDELLRWGVAQDNGYALHSVPGHHS